MHVYHCKKKNVQPTDVIHDMVYYFVNEQSLNNED